MSETIRPLQELRPGESFTADEDGALVITEQHTHSDILRYVVADIGEDEAISLIESLKA